MTSTFRLTRAEFKKIFKRPSVFIMALILVATIFASLYLFNPISIPNSSIDYNQINSQGYYSSFYSDIENSKKDLDNKINSANGIINYYEHLYTRTNNLASYYNLLIEAINKIKPDKSSSEKKSLYEDLGLKLNQFYEAYINFDYFNLNNNSYDHIDITANNDNYLTKSCADIINLIDKYNKNTPDDFISEYNVNNYETKLKNLLDKGINFKTTTLNSLANAVQTYYLKYSEFMSSGASKLTTIESYRKLLKTSIESFQEYFKLITDYKFPIVLINNNDKTAIENILDEATAVIDLSVNNANMFSKQEEVYNILTRLKIAENFKAVSNSITQVNPSNSLIENLKENSLKVEENKTQLLTKIDELRNDSSIKNIQFAITEYKLLSESFENYTNDKIMLFITEDYDKSVYENFANYKFSEFSKYKTNERLTQSKYFIDNNIYSNSYANNFSFNQKSTTEDTNVYDFVYFAMELSTIIIVLFAMMLICNLITGETESGTIKLLLVRPYRRSKIITSKLFATLFFVIIFMLFAFVLSFVGGYYMFGDSTTPILAIFNASTPIVMSPLALMCINVLFLLLDVIFYVIIALMLSILFRNYAGSITASLVILIIMLVLNLLFGTTFWYTLLPGMNLHLFKFFGNAFIPLAEASVLQSVLITTIESSMTFIYSILMYLSYSAIFITIAYAVFANRDF